MIEDSSDFSDSGSVITTAQQQKPAVGKKGDNKVTATTTKTKTKSKDSAKTKAATRKSAGKARSSGISVKDISEDGTDSDCESVTSSEDESSVLTLARKRAASQTTKKVPRVLKATKGGIKSSLTVSGTESSEVDLSDEEPPSKKSKAAVPNKSSNTASKASSTSKASQKRQAVTSSSKKAPSVPAPTVPKGMNESLPTVSYTESSECKVSNDIPPRKSKEPISQEGTTSASKCFTAEVSSKTQILRGPAAERVSATQAVSTKSQEKRAALLANAGTSKSIVFATGAKKKEVSSGNALAPKPDPRTEQTGEGKPVITTQPVSQVGWSGGKVIFHTGATGSSELRYQWRLDTTTLQDCPEVEHNAIRGASKSTLIMSNLTSNFGLHGGSTRRSLTCIVTNAYGTVTSNVASLIIRDAPSKLGAQLMEDYAAAATLASKSGLSAPPKIILPQFNSRPSEKELDLVKKARSQLNEWSRRVNSERSGIFAASHKERRSHRPYAQSSYDRSIPSQCEPALQSNNVHRSGKDDHHRREARDGGLASSMRHEVWQERHDRSNDRDHNRDRGHDGGRREHMHSSNDRSRYDRNGKMISRDFQDRNSWDCNHARGNNRVQEPPRSGRSDTKDHWDHGRHSWKPADHDGAGNKHSREPKRDDRDRSDGRRYDGRSDSNRWGSERESHHQYWHHSGQHSSAFK